MVITSNAGKLKKNFQDRLYNFVLKLTNFIGSLNERDMITKVISNQLARSGTSILSNYVEGKSASSRKDYINYFNHSLKSANESKIWISLLRDTNKCESKEALMLMTELEEISKIFASSIITLKRK
ncbi:four helix bundle protein [Candidatus Woesebacteria bacterium]|nr:MAG: four helix bundle protein [Candidatus Woesebacteria bacterium]